MYKAVSNTFQYLSSGIPWLPLLGRCSGCFWLPKQTPGYSLLMWCSCKLRLRAPAMDLGQSEKKA